MTPTTQPTPHELTARAELDLARTVAANLPKASSPEQWASRAKLALACCKTAQDAAIQVGLVDLANQAFEQALHLSDALVREGF